MNKKWLAQSKANQKKYKRFLQRADKNKIIPQLELLHNEVFSTIDCLACANCCKNYSPRFKPPDVKRIAKHLHLTESAFAQTYLMRDEEGDEVLKQLPCPFLQQDNKCTIYDVRPSDCARYPYTNEDVLLKKSAITLKNSTVCPAVYEVLEKITKDYFF